MLDLFLAALVLGFLFNAAPGAIFAESLRRGIRAALPLPRVQIGSLIGDFTWAVLGLAGAARSSASLILKRRSPYLGRAFSPTRLWQLRETGLLCLNLTLRHPQHHGIGIGIGLSLSNPMNITYWAGRHHHCPRD